MHRDPTWNGKEETAVGDRNSTKNGKYPLRLLCSHRRRASICLRQKGTIVIVKDGGTAVLVADLNVDSDILLAEKSIYPYDRCSFRLFRLSGIVFFLLF